MLKKAGLIITLCFGLMLVSLPVLTIPEAFASDCWTELGPIGGEYCVSPGNTCAPPIIVE
jgi:hypothetical protein